MDWRDLKQKITIKKTLNRNNTELASLRGREIPATFLIFSKTRNQDF